MSFRVLQLPFRVKVFSLVIRMNAQRSDVRLAGVKGFIVELKRTKLCASSLRTINSRGMPNDLAAGRGISEPPVRRYGDRYDQSEDRRRVGWSRLVGLITIH